jgi:hypothetical protein
MTTLTIIAAACGIGLIIYAFQYGNERITLRQWFYRTVYLRSLGWRWTKSLRKFEYCEVCGRRAKIAKPLHLHHVDYSGYGWHSLIVPDLVSPMQTLCARHHRQAHGKGK